MTSDAILIASALTRALPNIANQIQTVLKQKAPFDTGVLEGSIKVTSGSNGIMITMVDYGKFVEFGVPVRLGGSVPKFPNYGHRPNPFIRHTMHVNFPKIVVDAIKEEL